MSKFNKNKPDLTKFSIKPEIITIIIAICVLIIAGTIYSEITTIKVTAEPSDAVSTDSETADSYATHYMARSNWNVGETYTGTYSLIDVNTKEIIKTYTIVFTPKSAYQGIDVKIPLTSDEHKKLFDTKEYSLSCDLQEDTGD